MSHVRPRSRRLLGVLAILAAFVATLVVMASNPPVAQALNGSTGNLNVTVTPTTNLTDGQAIGVSVTATNSTLIYEIQAHICIPGSSISNTFDFSFAGPYCVLPAPHTGGLGTGDYEVVKTLAGVAASSLSFKAGVGTVGWTDGSPFDPQPHSLTCGAAHACDLVLQFQVSGSDPLFFTAPLSYAGGGTTSTSSSTSSSSTSSTSSTSSSTSTSTSSTSSTSTTLPVISPFSDVPTNSPFYGDIVWLVNSGVTGGYSDGTFKPAAPVSRQAMAAFLYRFAGKPNGESPTCSPAAFVDVPVGAPFCGEIKWLVSAGIASGYPDYTFKPTAAVSRQAMAAFLYRFKKVSAPACTSGPFTDVPMSQAFCKEITWLVDQSIASGYSDGTYRPTNAVSRQAMAAFLHRLSALPA